MQKIKKYGLCGLVLLLLCFNGEAIEVQNISEYIKKTPFGLKVEIFKYCKDTFRHKKKNCIFQYKSIHIKVMCMGNDPLKIDNDNMILCKSDLILESFGGIQEVTSGRSIEKDKHPNTIIDAADHLSHNVIFHNNFPYNLRLKYTAGVNDNYSSIKSLTVRDGNPEDLYQKMVDTKMAPRQIYEFVLESTVSFYGRVSLRDQPHVERYIQTLRDGLAILDDPREFSLLDWRVRESARRIMIFGMVVSNTLHQYAHVDEAKSEINAINTLTTQIRKSYGDQGLGGSVSKATGGVLELVELELKEIRSIKGSVGHREFKLYTNLINKVRTLMMKVFAGKYGDAIAASEGQALLAAWNAQAWQNELNLLLAVPMEDEYSVSQNLSILLIAMGSIRDITNLKFKIPSDEWALGAK